MNILPSFSWLISLHGFVVKYAGVLQPLPAFCERLVNHLELPPAGLCGSDAAVSKIELRDRAEWPDWLQASMLKSQYLCIGLFERYKDEVMDLQLFKSALLPRVSCPHTPASVLARSKLWATSGRAAFVSYSAMAAVRSLFGCVLAWVAAPIGARLFAFVEEWTIDFDGRSFDSWAPSHRPQVPVSQGPRALIAANLIQSRVVFLACSSNAKRGWVTPESHQGYFKAPATTATSLTPLL
jgi:hypothetical protein